MSIHSPSSFRDGLVGKDAFYHQPNYSALTAREFDEKNTLPTSYTWHAENHSKDTEYKIIRIVKEIFSLIFYPLHLLIGLVVLPASIAFSKSEVANMRSSILKNEDNVGQWKFKRLTVEVDGYRVDAMIVGDPSTLGNGRWVLASNGNNELYEHKFQNQEGDLQQILQEIQANALVFNYPGVGASSGFSSRQAMVKSYRAMLQFLEDKEKGIGAKQIIGLGHSVGGGVQGDALRTHELKKEIEYVFIKRQTFSDLKTIASNLTIRPLGFLLTVLGWNISSVESSKNLTVPEIIMQTINVSQYQEFDDGSKVIDDGVINADSSLAKTLLKDKVFKGDKVFIGMPERHNEPLRDPSFLGENIKGFLTPLSTSVDGDEEIDDDDLPDLVDL